jgi:hypothetical protein
VAVDLEEHVGVETGGERCEECGAQLTERELELVLESGGPVLCTIHAQEQLDTLAEEEPAEPAA